MQFESATKGNVVMKIWLGKQYLGQRDNLDQNINDLQIKADWNVPVGSRNASQCGGQDRSASEFGGRGTSRQICSAPRGGLWPYLPPCAGAA